MSARRYVVVEGHGEVEAVHNLLTRLSQRLDDVVPWARPMRWPNLHQWDNDRSGGVRAAIEFVRGKGDAASLLVLRDEDDLCPATVAPAISQQIREIAPPMPTSYVLLKPEYEVLFLPCLDDMAGRQLDFQRPGLLAGTAWDGASWESRRGVKEWLSAHYDSGRVYKPTVDQLPLTRLIDLDKLAKAGVPCFGTLERAVRFLVTKQEPGAVYP